MGCVVRLVSGLTVVAARSQHGGQVTGRVPPLLTLFNDNFIASDPAVRQHPLEQDRERLENNLDDIG